MKKTLPPIHIWKNDQWTDITTLSEVEQKQIADNIKEKWTTASNRHYQELKDKYTKSTNT